MSDANGFSQAERQAMRERAEELRSEKGGKKKADQLQALMDTIDALEGPDQALVLAVHNIVGQVAPQPRARTWYGMPAYEKDGEVLVFVQVSSKFDTRYSTVGFNPCASLDDGPMWPTAYAIHELNDDVRERLRSLISQAAGAIA